MGLGDAPGVAPVDWESWRPSRPVRDLAKLTEQEKRALRGSELAELARSLDIANPPEVPLERWINVAERGPSAEACLADAGFTVKSHADGQGWGLESQIGAEQASSYHMAVYVCTAMYFVDPDMMQELTGDQLRILYEYYVGYSVPCLAGLGYPRPEPPSLETFLGTFDKDPWLPIEHIGLDLSGSEAAERVIESCKQSPPLAALYGE